MPNLPVKSLMRRLRRLAGVRELLDQPDTALVTRFVEEGDQDAFEALVRRHGAMVLSVCRRVLRNDADAEDAFQATFLVLARKAGTIRKGNSVGSWLHGIALRLAMRARVAAARRLAHERQVPARASDPLRAGLQELAAALDEELSRMPARYRDPLVLCYLQGYSRAQAASQLGWSLRTIVRHLERGRGLLRHRLERRGIAVSAALGACGIAEQLAPAAVTAALRNAVMRNVLVALGTAADGAIPARVIALADGLVTAMSAKLKVAGVLLLAGTRPALVWHGVRLR